MKRKIINGLLALALLLPAVGGFTSCKDTDEDQFNTLKKEQYTLEEKIQKLNEALESMKTMQSQCQEACKTMMQTMLANYLLKQDFEAYKAEVAPILQQYAALQSTVTTIQNTITTIQGALAAQDQKNQEVDLAISTINNTLAGMNTTISSLQSDLGALQTNLSNLQNTVGNINTTVNGIQTSLSSLQTTVGELSSSLTSLTGTVTSMQTQIAPIIADWDTVKQQAYDSYTWVTTNKVRFAAMDSILNVLDSVTIPQMQNDIDSLKLDVDQLAANLRDIDGQINGKGGILDWQRVNGAKIDSLRKDVDNLFARIDNMVTGVILQGTVNPVFGSMSLPINVQSNMLIAYWGINQYGKEYDFPADRSAQEFDNEIVITDEDWAMLEAAGIKKFFTVNEGNLVDGVGNAGRVYVTVNPNNVDFTGKILPIVNSRDEESGIVLSSLRKSDEVLTFGWSRSDNAKNGFYEADATLTAENIEKVAVSIDDRLIPAMKEALQDRTKKDFGKLVKIIYDQFDGILPANGLKAAWTVNDQPFSVYSQYNLAATAFKPLSFKFMQGMSVRNLPTITPISGQAFNLDRFKIKVEMPEFTIDASGIT
ncbi:MAG: hypothetical protein K2M65_00080, partial [Muribaculaceae bacterium]|nr:hypothetical protein [Muribaculaceae bacterium]